MNDIPIDRKILFKFVVRIAHRKILEASHPKKLKFYFYPKIKCIPSIYMKSTHSTSIDSRNDRRTIDLGSDKTYVSSRRFSNLFWLNLSLSVYHPLVFWWRTHLVPPCRILLTRLNSGARPGHHSSRGPRHNGYNDLFYWISRRNNN